MKKKNKVLRVLLIILLMVILFIAGFVGYSAYKNGWGVKGMIQTAMGQDEKKLAAANHCKRFGCSGCP